MFETFNILDRETMEGPNATTRAVGTGPFMFVEWQPGSQLRLTRNPNYWRTGPATPNFSGISHLRRGTNLKSVLDGASKTYLIGEKRVPVANYSDGAALGDNVSLYAGYCSDLHRFAGVLEKMTEQLREIVATLQKPKNITQRLVEIHRLENDGDDIYHAAIAELFHDEKDPLTVLKWKEIYEKLEAAIDRCENVANIIESVIIKHT